MKWDVLMILRGNGPINDSDRNKIIVSYTHSLVLVCLNGFLDLEYTVFKIMLSIREKEHFRF